MSSFINNDFEDTEMTSSNIVENTTQNQTMNSIVPNEENQTNNLTK